MRIFLTCFLLLILSNLSFSQVPPPAPAEPKGDYKPLIDELVVLCRYDLLFEEIKERELKEYAAKYDWLYSEMEEYADKIQYDE